MSSGTSAGNPPPLGLDDFTLRQEEFARLFGNAFVYTGSLNFYIFLRADFQLAGGYDQIVPDGKV